MYDTLLVCVPTCLFLDVFMVIQWWVVSCSYIVCDRHLCQLYN